MKAIGDSDRGRTITVALHEELCLELPENATTGYTWSAPTFDHHVLAQLQDETVAASSGAIGAGGSRRFTFRAIAIGRTAVQLSYRRPWERNAAPAKTYEITVAVDQ